MSVTIQIPTALRSYTGGLAVVNVAAVNVAAVNVAGFTVGEALTALTDAHPALAKHLRAETGELRSFVNVYLQDEDIRFLGRELAPVRDGDVLTIVPSIAGGTL